MDRIGRVVSSDSSSLHVWDPFLGSSIAQLDVGTGMGGASAASASAANGYSDGGQRNPPLTTLAALPPCLVIAANTDGILRLFDLRCYRYANALKVSLMA